MFCKYCGKEVAEDASFCQNCGKQLLDEQVAGQTSTDSFFKKESFEQKQESNSETPSSMDSVGSVNNDAIRNISESMMKKPVLILLLFVELAGGLYFINKAMATRKEALRYQVEANNAHGAGNAAESTGTPGYSNPFLPGASISHAVGKTYEDIAQKLISDSHIYIGISCLFFIGFIVTILIRLKKRR